MSHERGLQPKPAVISLPGACKAAIQHGNTLADIRVDRWAATFACGVEMVRTEWEAALTEMSRQPRNYEEMDK